MKLTRVTMTGADDGTKPEKLFELAAKYPFVEWAILLSRNSMGQRRFPSLKWMVEMLDQSKFVPNLYFSGHLCGAWVRELLMGNTAFVAELGYVWEAFQRVQINTHGIEHKFDAERLTRVLEQCPEKEFIFQYDNANRALLNLVESNKKIHCSTLFDLSHGAGISPDEWPKPIPGISCGYAGGIGPENVVAQLRLIADKTGNEEFWIDMETKVRSANDQVFDLDKVEAVLATCKPYILP